MRLFDFGGSDLGTATSRRVNCFIFSKADGSDLSAGAFGVSFMASAFCRALASAYSVGHVVAGVMSAPISLG